MPSTQIGCPLKNDQNKLFVHVNPFPKYLKLKPKKERRVLGNNNEQIGPLIDHICETGTFAKDTKIIYNVLPKDITESGNYSKFRNNTKRYFYDMASARCMATGLL